MSENKISYPEDVQRAVVAHLYNDELLEALDSLLPFEGATGFAGQLRLRVQSADENRKKETISRGEYEVIRNRIRADIMSLVRGDEPGWLLSDDDRQELEQLLDQMETWFKNEYSGKIGDAPRLDMSFLIDLKAVDFPRPSNQEINLRSGESAIALFERFGGQILILGEAGSGKTSVLAQIAGHLVRQVRQDPRRPIPVVIDLNNWQPSDANFAEWVVGQVHLYYVQLRESVRSWLAAHNRLAILFENLDSVPADSRSICVREINAFLDQYSPSVAVVVCRTAAYEQLPIHLRLHAALRLQPLIEAEIINYLRHANLPALSQIITADPDLIELARTPFGLNLLYEVYKDQNVDDVTLLSGETPGARRRHLLDQYVDRVFARLVPQTKAIFSRGQTMSWLSWQACRMKENRINLFWFERLQPNWLPNAFWQRAYILLSRLIFGLTAGFLGGIPIGLGLGSTPDDLLRGFYEGTLAGIIGGFVVGAFDAFFERPLTAILDRRVVTRWHALLATFIIFVSVAFAVFLVFFTLKVEPWPKEGAAVGVLVGLSFGLVFGIEPKDGRRRPVNDIKAGSVDRLRWDWTRVRRFGWIGLAIGAAGALIVSVTDWPLTGSGNPTLEWAGTVASRLGLGPVGAAVTVVIDVGIICGAATVVVSGISGSVLNPKGRSSPNQGIRLAAQNAVTIGLISGIAFALIGAVMGFLASPASVWAFTLYGLFIGYLMFLWFGGLDTYLHHVLRLFLWWLKLTPRPDQHQEFLDDCVELRFLISVFAGYQFSHVYWQEYFANQATDRSTDVQINPNASTAGGAGVESS